MNQKIKEADAVLQKRTKELVVMEKKMRQELEESTTKQKDEMIIKARWQRLKRSSPVPRMPVSKSAVKLKRLMEIKIVDYAESIASDILGVKQSKRPWINTWFLNLLKKLNKVDMSRIGIDIKVADVISADTHP